MARRPTAAQLREKRARTMAIVCSVLFLIVAVVQGPKLLKALHGSAPPTGGTVAGALPAGVNPTLPSAKIGQTAAAAPILDGQLGDLSRFALKDPFHALVQGAAPVTGSSTAPTSPGASKGTSAPKKASSAKAAPKSPAAAAAAAVAPTVTFTATKTPKPAPNAAVVKTNGRRQIIFVGDHFPTTNPLFKLVALDKKDIRIGVLGGSFTSGAATIKLKTGKQLTLANQADGSRYVLKLLRLTNATPPVKTTGSSSTSTPAATTPATTTTTPATTTPAGATPAPATPAG